jgi:hypothetical protein
MSKILKEKLLSTEFNVGFELECYFTSDYDKNNFFHEAQDIFEELHEELTSKGYEVDENLIKMDNDPSIQVPEEFTTYECYSCDGIGHNEDELCECCDGTGYEPILTRSIAKFFSSSLFIFYTSF